MREYVLILAMVALPFSAAHSRVSCDLDNGTDSKTVIASPDFDFENGDLVAEDGFDNVMRITPKGDLYIHEENIDVQVTSANFLLLITTMLKASRTMP